MTHRPPLIPSRRVLRSRHHSLRSCLRSRSVPHSVRHSRLRRVNDERRVKKEAAVRSEVNEDFINVVLCQYAPQAGAP